MRLLRWLKNKFKDKSRIDLPVKYQMDRNLFLDLVNGKPDHGYSIGTLNLEDYKKLESGSQPVKEEK